MEPRGSLYCFLGNNYTPSDYTGCERGKLAQVRYARRLLHIANDVTFISFTSLIISYAFGELNTYYCNFFIDEVELQEQCNFPTDIEALQVQCSNPTEVVARQGWSSFFTKVRGRRTYSCSADKIWTAAGFQKTWQRWSQSPFQTLSAISTRSYLHIFLRNKLYALLPPHHLKRSCSTHPHT